MARIVAIDDEDLIRMLLTHALQGQGHDVIVAADGDAGLAAVADATPDLIITDLNMPGMSGWDVLATLKAGTDTVALSVIALSGNASDEDRQKGAAAGFSGFVGKPLDMAQLLAEIAKVLGTE
ncbi:MAG: response regulator [Rhodospirillaceae bacterium]|nr:response regulator [Rhodospirillaceae bacterium]MBT7511683.1 response regulator [Rhodospirillaceae bacterium]